jgi:predicted nucleotidyltransferase
VRSGELDVALPEVDFGRIVGVLTEHGVRFVLIGGLAAQAQGSPFPTEDVDVTPDRSAQNLTDLSAALRELNARIRTSAVEGGLAFDHDGESLAAAGVWNLTTDAGDLDISFVPTGTEGYADLIRDARATEIFGVVVPIASLADIIRSKQAANRPKDQRVLPTLREILANRDLDTN